MVNLILGGGSRQLLGWIIWRSKRWAGWVGKRCLLCWSFPQGAWVDHPIFASLWGVLDEAVVHSWRLIGWDQLRGNASPKLATVMQAMVVESVRCCGWTTVSSIPPGLACSAWSIGGWPWFLCFDPPFCTKAVGYSAKVAEGIWVMNAHQSHDLGWFWGVYHPENFKPLGRHSKA